MFQAAVQPVPQSPRQRWRQGFQRQAGCGLRAVQPFLGGFVQELHLTGRIDHHHAVLQVADDALAQFGRFEQFQGALAGQRLAAPGAFGQCVGESGGDEQRGAQHAQSHQIVVGVAQTAPQAGPARRATIRPRQYLDSVPLRPTTRIPSAV
jgi:hypothetical protein